MSRPLAKRTEIGQNSASGLPPSPPTQGMDQNTLDSLRAALAASPENLPLLKVLMGAYLERDEPETAVTLLAARTPAELSGAEERLLAARACLAAGHPERALGFAVGDAAEAKMLQARCLLALERNADGLRCYDAAVAANPTLESPALRDRLLAVVRTFPARDGRERRGDRGDAAADREEGAGDRTPRLRVIANDETLSHETDRFMAPALPPVTFADVGGLDPLKQQIHRRIVLPFQKPSLFQRFKKRVGGGILLYGAPGCGKTLLARATAGECKAAFYNVAISDILDMYIGESERKLHAIFERARQSAPAVLFFDELEALGGKRQFTREATSAKLVSQFLSEMDGFAQNNSGVLILGATNVPWAIDPAFRRPGRFDRVLFVPPPDRAAREAILALQLRDRPLAVQAGADQAAQLDLAAFSRQTSGFSGADLQELVETAADEAIATSLTRGEETPISAAHLQSALSQVKPTTLEWLTTARNYARYANEAGQYDEVLAFLDKHGRR
jgi:transitional endoplasmic reticulum ATPase